MKMKQNQIQEASSNGRYLAKVDGKIWREFDQQPTLDKIREVDRKSDSPLRRIDIFDSDLHCTRCSDALSDRFASDMKGNLLCWQCANSLQQKDTNVRPSVDPAKVVLSESGLYHKSLCDYVINVASGCSHGCKFCYVPSTPNISARKDMLEDRTGIDDTQKEWGNYLLYRDDLPERLGRKLERKQKWNTTERGRGVVMLSSGTDCYQDRRTAQITRGCVAELVKHRIPVRILTRSPAVVRDIDLYKKAVEVSEEGELVRIGSSIPCLNEEHVSAIEPNAPVPSARLNALQRLSDEGVPVYVSMSPTYPTQTREDLEELIAQFSALNPEVVFHEPINPRGGNFRMTIEAARKAGNDKLADELENLLNRDYWVDYSLKHMRWAQEAGKKYDVDVHTWPDKQVISHVDSDLGKSLREQRKKPSPESFPEVSLSH